jgi:SAM-dependent methyltransferase
MNSSSLLALKTLIDEHVHFVHDYRWFLNISPVQFFHFSFYEDPRFKCFFPFDFSLFSHQLQHESPPFTCFSTSIEFEKCIKRLNKLLVSLSKMDDPNFERLFQFDFTHSSDSSHAQTSDPHLLIGMTPKKTYEVQKVLSLIRQILYNQKTRECSSAGPLHFVEIGCGLGYLSSYLAIQLQNTGMPRYCVQKELGYATTNNSSVLASSNSYSFIALDRNAHVIQKAKERHVRILKSNTYASLANVPLSFETCSVSYPLNDQLSNIIMPVSQAFLYSLHGCGDLSSTMCRIFHHDCRFTTLVQINCCYHLLTGDGTYVCIDACYVFEALVLLRHKYVGDCRISSQSKVEERAVLSREIFKKSCLSVTGKRSRPPKP